MPIGRQLLALGAAALLAGCGTTVVDATSATAVQGAGPTSDGLGAPVQPGGPRLGDVTAPGAPVEGGPTAPLGSAGGGAPDDASAPGPAGAPAPAPRTAGGRITAPLKVGITYIDNSQSSAAVGFEDQRTVNARNVSEAMVEALNAAGGVQGRKLDPVYFQFNGQSADYGPQAAAACARFTQDTTVALVIDNAFGTTGGFRECLQREGVVSLTTQNEGDRESSRKATLHASPSDLVLDRTYSAVLRQLAATGYAGPGNQLGVVVEDCPDVNRAWDRTLAPLVKQLRLKPPVIRKFSCAVGFGSLGDAGSAISSAVLAFRQAGVDRVMFVSHFEDVSLLLFAPAAESQGYRPGFMLSSGAQAHALRPQLPEGQWPQFHGVGSSPYGDTDHAEPSGSDPRCLSLVKSANLLPANHDDVGTVLFICAPFLLLDAVLARSGGASDVPSLLSAINGLGTSFVAPGIVGGRTLFGPDRRDGADAVRVFGWVGACECLRYTGPAVRAPQ